jgi:peptide/nickel transport system permease protein
MYKYVIKRLLLTIPILLAVIILVFVMINIVPGDPGRNILGIQAKQEEVDRLNHELGYDQPLHVRLVKYLKDIIFHFDFGKSWMTNHTVVDDINRYFIYTFRVVLFGTAVYALLGVPLGVLSAVKQYSVTDNVMRILAMIFNSMPSFWFGLVALLIFSLWLGWLPSNGVDTWKHYILPVGVYGIGSAGGLLRTTRTIMLESVRQDYIRTARAKGASEKRIIWKHALPNVSLPLINLIGLTFGAMLGGTVLIETAFSIPGLGTLCLDAVRAKDVPLVMGTTIFLAAIWCLAVLIVDIISAYADPRVKAKYTT